MIMTEMCFTRDDTVIFDQNASNDSQWDERMDGQPTALNDVNDEKKTILFFAFLICFLHSKSVMQN